MRLRYVIGSALLLVVSIGLSGCFSGNPEDVNVFIRPDEADVTSEEYVFQAPDTVTIMSSKVPEFSRGSMGSTIGLTQQIRPDGKISVEAIGEIMVAGKTPRQVAEIISKKMSELYKLTGDYPVDVRANNLSKFYYMIGELRSPGAKIYTGRETTLSAISKAVPTVRAWKRKIQVVRPSLDLQKEPKIFTLNYVDMYTHGNMKYNVLLQEGDIIYVPPTILGQIGLTIEELVGPILRSSSAVSAMDSP